MSEKVQRVEYRDGELAVHLTGGGAMQKIPLGASVEQAVMGLRDLALLLERGARDRAPPGPHGDPPRRPERDFGYRGDGDVC